MDDVAARSAAVRLVIGAMRSNQHKRTLSITPKECLLSNELELLFSEGDITARAARRLAGAAVAMLSSKGVEASESLAYLKSDAKDDKNPRRDVLRVFIHPTKTTTQTTLGYVADASCHSSAVR